MQQSKFYLVTLRMRNDIDKTIKPDEIEANEDATGVVMHKDSVWNQQWENFKNSKVGESNLIPFAPSMVQG